MSAHPVFKLIGEIQDDLNRANARFTALRAHLAAENLEPVVLPVCPRCGPVRLPATTTIGEHLENVHGIVQDAAA